MGTTKPHLLITMKPARLIDKLMTPEQWKRLDAIADVDRNVIEDFHVPGIEDRLSGVDYLYSGWNVDRQVDLETLAKMPNLKAVVAAAGSATWLFTPEALERARAKGILMSNSGYVNGIPVAEFCLAQILLINKDYFRALRIYRERRSRIDREIEFPTAGNYHKTVGFITASSRIGRHLLDLLKPYRLRVLAESRSMDERETASYGAEKADIETVFRESDIVSLHTPSLPATRGMIDARYFHLMKDGATFLNTARGAVVNADDLLAELKTGRINAVLDVTDPQEPLPPDSELWDLPNVVITPHIAGSEGVELQAMGENVADEFTRLLGGEAMRYAE